ncbi:MAG: sugar ABC transporter permease [SAR324 cluster bacterium]|nr:sugar ABC transporter permease [SAR324 cluster bacterium]
MPHRTFIYFILPSLLSMILLIAVPIFSAMTQSLFIAHKQVIIVTETCDPFGCKNETTVDAEATADLREKDPLGIFNGFATYTNRNHLASTEVKDSWNNAENITDFISKIVNLPFYKALAFTLTYTFLVTPFVIIFGFLIALAVNSLANWVKGPTIFFSLLPMIVTPLIGSLILFWMIDAEGILGSTLQRIFNDNSLSLKASPVLTWIMLIVYGIWHSTPFSFIVFYAGLQTVPEETIEAAMLDGASLWQQKRHVIIPYLMPLIIFVTLIQLMDNFRVFEPIVGFNASANATSLSWIIFNDLRGEDVQLFGSAAATSMLTIIGVAVLLTPVLIKTWKEFNSKTI